MAYWLFKSEPDAWVLGHAEEKGRQGRALERGAQPHS